jgi:hypothetical protein
MILSFAFHVYTFAKHHIEITRYSDQPGSKMSTKKYFFVYSVSKHITQSFTNEIYIPQPSAKALKLQTELLNVGTQQHPPPPPFPYPSFILMQQLPQLHTSPDIPT